MLPWHLNLLDLKQHGCVQRRGQVVRMGRAIRRGTVQLRRKLRDNERLLIVAGSSLLMSVSHTALRPVLPFFAKVFASLPSLAPSTE